MKLTKIRGSIPTLMVVIIVAKLVGMLRDVVLANYFGTSNISDAYLIASSVPTLLFYFIGHSISTAYIPMYNKVKNIGGEKSGLEYTNNILNFAFLLGTVLVVLLLIWPEAVIKLFASGFDADTIGITAGFIRTSVASMYIMIALSVLGGYLNANKSFIVPASVSLPRNAVVISSIVVASKFGIQWLGWGLLFSYIAELLLLLPFAIKKGYRYSLNLKIRDENVKETGYVVLPILLGMCVSQINKIIDRSLASMVCEGGISALSYASIINNAVQEILVTGIITVLFSNCAAWVAKGEYDQVKAKLSNVLNVLIMVLLPATFGVIILSKPIVTLMLARGEFDSASIAMTSGALCFYTSGLLFLAVRDTLVKVFYAYKNTRTTTVVAIIAICVNIVFNFLLHSLIGLNGLALATAISAVFNAITLYILLRKQIGDFGLRVSIRTVAKSLLACVIMTVLVLVVKSQIMDWPVLLGLLLCVCVGIVSYFFIALLLRIDPLISILKKMKRSPNKKI